VFRKGSGKEIIRKRCCLSLSNRVSLPVQIVLGGQVFSTVFSIRRGVAPAGSFGCESLLPPGLAGSKYVYRSTENTFFLGLFGVFFSG
jgi:hypothetical protein